MKTPTNLNSNNLFTWLQSASEIRMADLYTITLKAGTVLRYTTWDTNLLVNGNTFLTGPPNIERTAIEEQLGMDVASIEVTIKAGSSDLVNGVPILQAVSLGLFDGAAFKIERLFMDFTGQQIGTVIRFAGFIGPVDELTSSYVKLSAHAGTELLQMQLPAIILQPGCTNTLFDARCTLTKSNLLKFSEQFDNAVWTLSWATPAAAVTPNSVADPNGNLTADMLSFGATGAGQESGIQQDSGVVPVNGSVYTFAVWLRAASAITCVIRLVQATGQNDIPVTVNLTTSWQRFSMSVTMAGAGAGTLLARIQNLGNTSARSVFAWGAQLELGPVATAYQSTTDASAAFAEWNTVQSGTLNKLISLSTKPTGYYDNGQIVFTSGANNGLVKAVKSYSAQQFFFNSPLPFPPNAGDTFIAYPGCDKTQATCSSKFNNLANFEGFPYVPVPETAL